MVRAADLLAEGRRIPGHGRHRRSSPRLGAGGPAHPDEATDSWDDKVAVERFVGKGGRFVRGRARRHRARSTVEVDGETITAAQGPGAGHRATAWVPPMFEAVPHWTNREAIAAEAVPDVPARRRRRRHRPRDRSGHVPLRRRGDRWSRRGPRLAGAEEPEASAADHRDLRARGRDGAHRRRHRARRGLRATAGATVTLADGTVLTGERMLVATGRRRRPGRARASAALGLDESAQALPVDGLMRVSARVCGPSAT